MEWFNFIAGITINFWKDRYIFALLFAAALVMILLIEKEKIKRYTFLWFTGIVLLFIYNPLTWFIANRFFDHSAFEQYYMRFFSVIPVMIIVAYGLTLVIAKLAGVKKLVGLVAALAIVLVCGRLVYAEDWFTKAENRNKVPQDVITICDIFADYEGDKIRIMAPQDIAVYLRQMDSRFSMPYAREPLPQEAFELTNPNPDTLAVSDYCATNDVDYVVTFAGDSVLDTYFDNGYELYGRTTNYAVLKAPAKWVLKEYKDNSNLQGLCYTLYNKNDGTLIVIDGGHVENAKDGKITPGLREAIEAYGGKVDAWIITHYHKDHVDAFNEIYADPQGIDIKEIYVSPLDADVFYSRAQEWDDVDSFDRFMELTAGADNINLVKRDDVLEFSDDLTITFLNSYDDSIKDVEDIPNNASLVFKMETKNRSALFCADCHSRVMAERLIKDYGDELKADILQCGHHGNNSMPEDTGFYEKVSPSIAIFDMPEEMLTSPEYTAGALAAYLQKMDCKIVWYSDKPNGFAFY